MRCAGQENEAGETPSAGVDLGRRRLQELRSAAAADVIFTRYFHEKVILVLTCSAGQENEAGETPTAGVDWGRRKLQEAAAVLELLVNASLVLSPVDAEALRYVCKTARLLQVMLAAQV